MAYISGVATVSGPGLFDRVAVDGDRAAIVCGGPCLRKSVVSVYGVRRILVAIYLVAGLRDRFAADALCVGPLQSAIRRCRQRLDVDDFRTGVSHLVREHVVDASAGDHVFSGCRRVLRAWNHSVDRRLLATSSHNGGSVMIEHILHLLLNLSIIWIPAILVIVGVVMSLRRRKWLPVASPPRSRASRIIEALLVVSVAAPIVVLLLFERHTPQ